MAMSTKQRDFRGALLQTCSEEMGKETWGSLCFLYAVPEGVREKGRSAVLEHLVNTEAVSCERPGEFAERLTTDLGHANLAQVFLEALSEGDRASVETRGKAKRSPYSPDRRHGRHFTPSMIEIPVESSLHDDEGDDAPTELDDAAAVNIRPRAADGRYPAAPGYGEIFRQRHESDVSLCSTCSSGYNSWRSSSITSRSSMLSIQSHDHEDTDQFEREQQLQTVPELEQTASRHISSSSSSSSFEEVEFQSCRSSSLESLSTTGSLPRNMTAGIRGEVECHGPLDSRGKKEMSPECIDSPTHSTVRKTDTIILRHADIMSDIDRKRTGKVYRSLSSRDQNQQNAIDFELRFSPTSHEGSSASSLNVDVYGHKKRGVIPELDITVCMYDSALDKGTGVALEDCMAFQQRSSKGSFTFQGQYTALFSQLVDHETLCRATGETIVIQVAMEYSIVTQNTTQQ